jgi:hypothetical protein
MRLSYPCLVVSAVAVVGCGGQQTSTEGPPAVAYTVAAHQGKTALVIGKLTVVFDAIPSKANEVGGGGMLAVPGSGRTGNSTAHLGSIQIQQKWASGENVITVGATNFKLVNSGTKLQFGDKTFPIDETEQVIVVSADGTVS